MGAEVVLPDINRMTSEEWLRAILDLVFEANQIGDLDVLESLYRSIYTPTFHQSTGAPEAYLVATTLDEFLDNMRLIRKLNPKTFVQSKLVTVSVDEDAGHAIVVALAGLGAFLGASDHLVRDTVHFCHWKRTKEGNWMAYKIETLRGPGSYMF